MKEKIRNLILCHKNIREEMYHIIDSYHKTDLNGKPKKLVQEYNRVIDLIEQEYELRGIFINSLEDLL